MIGSILKIDDRMSIEMLGIDVNKVWFAVLHDDWHDGQYSWLSGQLEGEIVRWGWHTDWAIDRSVGVIVDCLAVFDWGVEACVATDPAFQDNQGYWRKTIRAWVRAEMADFYNRTPENLTFAVETKDDAAY